MKKRWPLLLCLLVLFAVLAKIFLLTMVWAVPKEKSAILYPYDEKGVIVGTPSGNFYRARLFTAGEHEETIVILIFFYGPGSESDYLATQISAETEDYIIKWKDVSVAKNGNRFRLIYPSRFSLISKPKEGWEFKEAGSSQLFHYQS